jgi:hypothetical protein
MKKNRSNDARDTPITTTLRLLTSVIVLAFWIHGVAWTATQPRPEYPRPDLVRAEWLNLNGEWDFALDPSGSGEDRIELVKLGWNQGVLIWPGKKTKVSPSGRPLDAAGVPRSGPPTHQ